MLGASIRKKGYKMSTGTNVSKESVMLHECVIQMRERKRGCVISLRHVYGISFYRSHKPDVFWVDCLSVDPKLLSSEALQC